MEKDDYNIEMENDYVKQIIVIRKDLKMRKGKIAAQAAHASMKVLLDNMIFEDERRPHPFLVIDSKFTKLSSVMHKKGCLYRWLNGAFTKVVVSVDSEEELFEIKQKAMDAGIVNALITDAGKTEFHGVPTNTALAIGPEWASKLEPITGDLKLL